MDPRHQGLSSAFDLSPWSYFLDFLLVPVVTAALMWLDPPHSALMVGTGMLGWSLAEYLIHRLLFHGRTRFEPMHQMHHELPKDFIGIASWGSFAGFAAVWWLAGSAFAIGFMLGYLFYCVIHVRMHHGRALRGYTAFMFRHHAAHHRGGQGNFGVSSPLWDLVFRTRN